MKNITLEKAEKFAIVIVRLYQYLTEEKNEYVLSKQILRSGTSIGANISEGEFASSKKDLLNKLYIALKECNETMYWLRLLRNSEYISADDYIYYYELGSELRKILTASTKTLKDKLESSILNTKSSITEGEQ